MNPPLARIRRSPYLWVTPVGWIVVVMAGCFAPPALPVVQVLPSYDLVDSRGESFGTEQLAGQVYVANLFFTRCTSVCPILTNSLLRLQRRYREDGIGEIRLVSISVDGEHDTPDQLAAYAARHEIESESWSLLTGPREQVRTLAIEGFRLALGDRQEDEQGLIDIEEDDTGHVGIVARRCALAQLRVLRGRTRGAWARRLWRWYLAVY